MNTLKQMQTAIHIYYGTTCGIQGSACYRAGGDVYGNVTISFEINHFTEKEKNQKLLFND